MKQSSGLGLFPGFPLFTGMLGFGLRCWLFSSVDSNGLLPENHIAGILSLILLALTLAVCLIGVKKAASSESYHSLFPTSALSAIGTAIGALGIGYAAITERSSAPMGMLLLILGILSCGALLFAAFCRYKGTCPNCLLYGLVAVYLMLRTLVSCRVWGSETQLQMYLFQLLASVFMMVACYYRAELSIRPGNCRRYVFFSQAAVFCCCLCLPLQDWLFYLSVGLWLAADFCTLPSANEC